MWILFLNPNGTVKSQLTQKISSTQGGLTGALVDGDGFGLSGGSLGDFDGNGPSVLALAVGAAGHDEAILRGAVWVLFLVGASCDPCDANCDGSVDLTDVEPFILLLLTGEGACDKCTGDTTGDGSVDLTDVEGFIACLLG